MKVGIIGVTGYGGIELARILRRHPEADITSVTGRSAAGSKLKDVFPHLSDLDLTITEDITESVDVEMKSLNRDLSAILVVTPLLLFSVSLLLLRQVL